MVVDAADAASQVPDEPGVDVAEHEPVVVHGFADEGVVVQQPLELEGAESVKGSSPRLFTNICPLTEGIQPLQLLQYKQLSTTAFLPSLAKCPVG